MNIEAGKYYRMRCGGAVRINDCVAHSAFPFQSDGYLAGWKLNGRYAYDNENIFDLVAEITEAEYDWIVSGELSSNTVQLKALQAEVKTVSSDRDFWKSMYKSVYDRIQEERRFEAAKAAMQGICSNSNWRTLDFAEIVKASVSMSDALLKALEESK